MLNERNVKLWLSIEQGMVYFTQAYGHDTGYRTESNPIDIYRKEYSN